MRGGSYARYAPSGHIVYGTAGSLRAVAFDVDTQDVQGVPVPILEGVLTGSAGAVGFDIAADGALTYIEGQSQVGSNDRQLVWVDRQGREERVDAPPRAYTALRISPDGARVAATIRDQDDDVWIWNTSRGTLTRLTFTPDVEGPAVWTPDGRSVVFSRRGHLFQRLADGTGAETQLLSAAGGGNQDSYQPLQFSPDASRLIIREPKSGQSDLSILAMTSERRVQPLISSPAQELFARLSPDGRWIAYDSNESDDYEIYVRPFPNVDGGRWQVSNAGGQNPVWSRNGRELFFLGQQPYRMMAVPIEPGATFAYGSPQVLFETRPGFGANTRSYDVAPDGQRFLMALGPDARSTAQSRIVLVQNWLEELKRLATRQ